MSLIERAARALCVELARQEGEAIAPEQIQLDTNLVFDYIDQNNVNMGSLVLAVLRAIREPSESMIKAGGPAGDWTPQLEFADWGEAANNVWQAMIDAALAEPLTGTPQPQQNPDQVAANEWQALAEQERAKGDAALEGE